MLSEGTERRLFLPGLFNEFIDCVEALQEVYFLMGLALKIRSGLFEQHGDLFIRVIKTRLSDRGCHRNVGGIVSQRLPNPGSNGLEIANSTADESQSVPRGTLGGQERICTWRRSDQIRSVMLSQKLASDSPSAVTSMGY